MPLVEHLNLPTFSRLREQGHEVLPLERAVHQDIRELHIGHAIVSRAVFTGLRTAVAEMKHLIREGAASR